MRFLWWVRSRGTVGIFKKQIDYTFYQMQLTELVTGWLIGFGCSFFASYVLFRLPVVSILLGGFVGFIAIPFYQNTLNQKRKKELLVQFSDLMESLAGSFSAGLNIPDAFMDAYQLLSDQYGETSYISQEIKAILVGLQNNYSIEMMLADFAKRSDLDDIQSFASTFVVCNRLGGNMKSIVTEAKEIISTKIEIEMDIETTITEKKNELNIMMAMPFIIIAMLGTLGNDLAANTLLNVIVKLIASALFMVAYVIGRKMIKIEV